MERHNNAMNTEPPTTRNTADDQLRRPGYRKRWAKYMTEVEQEFRVRVLLSVQRALLGEVTAKMRKIEVILATDALHLRVWHEGAATKEEKDDFDAIVVTDIAADLWTGIEPPKDPTFGS